MEVTFLYRYIPMCSLQVDLGSLFDGVSITKADNVSLSLAHGRAPVSLSAPVHIRPMEIEALRVVMT